MGERTGSRIFWKVWSYVIVLKVCCLMNSSDCWCLDLPPCKNEISLDSVSEKRTRHQKHVEAP
ncbi:hypothetical protein CTRU02_206528 [Colletotrichum truncatum]|uniref:Uncharacterized protein n=1 Tax=Colletotrichum truncatum TaxID=5467 RepID=A0ACC3Z740_COLTU